MRWLRQTWHQLKLPCPLCGWRMTGQWGVRVVSLAGILALWTLDVASAVPDVSNGFWAMDSQKTFHVALWVATGCFGLILLWGR